MLLLTSSFGLLDNFDPASLAPMRFMANNFEDNVSSKIFSIQKQNEISHKENYIKNAIAIAEATYGLIQEAISIRQQGKIKNSAYSSISAP